MGKFKSGDKVLHSHIGNFKNSDVYTIKEVSTWCEVLNIKGYNDTTTAYQLYNNTKLRLESWVHEQFLQGVNPIKLSDGTIDNSRYAMYMEKSAN